MTRPINLQEILETATNMFLFGEALMCLNRRNIAFKDHDCICFKISK